MADNSKIEWCNASWSPIRAKLKGSDRWGYHCERVSPGCKNCYASTMNGRMLPAWGTGLDYTVPNREKVEIFLDEAELLKPLKWKKPRRIFVESMSDWCATFVTDAMRDRIMAVEALCPQHTFLFLTKRAKECAEYFEDVHRPMTLENPLPNIHLGFSAENQECFDSRWSHMRKLAAAGWKVWCSLEPLLSAINISRATLIGPEGGIDFSYTRSNLLSWVVTGAESGHGARPCKEHWVRDIKNQCVTAGVAFFYKQAAIRGKKIPTPELDGRKWMEYPHAT